MSSVGVLARSSQTFSLVKYMYGVSSNKHLNHNSDPQLCLVLEHAGIERTPASLTLRIILRSETLETIRAGVLIEEGTRRLADTQTSLIKHQDLPIYGVCKNNALALSYRGDTQQTLRLQVCFKSTLDCMTVSETLRKLGMQLEDRTPAPVVSPGVTSIVSEASSRTTTNPAVHETTFRPSVTSVSPTVSSLLPESMRPASSVWVQNMPPKRPLPKGFSSPPVPVPTGPCTRARALQDSSTHSVPRPQTSPSLRPSFPRNLDMDNIPRLSPCALRPDPDGPVRLADQLDAPGLHDALVQYAALTDAERQAALDRFFVESLHDPAFVQLCVDMDRGWRGTVFSHITGGR